MKFTVLFLPLMHTAVAFAHDGGPAGHHSGIYSIKDLIERFIYVLQPLISIFIALALLYFFWGISQFILHADSDTEREKGRTVMFWGIIALFVMVSVWGLVRVLQNTFF